MRVRYMRVILFFDLPTITAKERKAYSRFRKNLIKEGFLMMQESVYAKLVINPTSAQLLRNRLKKMVPDNGLVQILTVTEKQYAGIDNLIGRVNTNVLNVTDRLVIF